jgi:hypothetical protein
MKTKYLLMIFAISLFAKPSFGQSFKRYLDDASQSTVIKYYDMITKSLYKK